MNVKDAVEEYKYAILECSHKTQIGYAQKLDVFTQWCEEHGLSLEQVKLGEVRKFIEYLRTQPSPRSGKPYSMTMRTLRMCPNWSGLISLAVIPS